MPVKVILHGQDRFQTTDLSGLLKGLNGEIVTATPGTDYLVPSALDSYVPTFRKVNGKTLTQDIVIGANDITFADGQTFQEKCDSGTLQGPPGKDGVAGSKGDKGDPGPNIVSTTTSTSLTGLIKGNGSNIQLAAAGVDYVIPSGNVATASKLERAVQINGVDFDGSKSITVYDNTKVPTSRTINGHALSDDLTLTASDIGADAAGTAAELVKGYLPLTGGTLTGNVTGRYFTGTWLCTTATTEWETNEFRVPVLDNVGWIYYKTKDHFLTSIGALSVAGTAAAANKLAKSVTITLSGDVTGSASFDGSGNITINTKTSNKAVWG